MWRFVVASTATIAVLILTVGPTVAGILMAVFGFSWVIGGFIAYSSRESLREYRDEVWARREAELS